MPGIRLCSNGCRRTRCTPYDKAWSDRPICKSRYGLSCRNAYNIQPPLMRTFRCHRPDCGFTARKSTLTLAAITEIKSPERGFVKIAEASTKAYHRLFFTSFKSYTGDTLQPIVLVNNSVTRNSLRYRARTVFGENVQIGLNLQSNVYLWIKRHHSPRLIYSSPVNNGRHYATRFP